jgi:hypothetical protein
MGRIAKAYRTLWEDGNVIEASDVRRAFSDAYDLVNGNLNSENFSTFSISWDNVSFSTSSWSSTSLKGVVEEIKLLNYHNIHFYADSCGSLSVFPGRIFINGKMNVVNTRIDIPITDILYTGGEIATGSFMILMGAGISGVITASDLSITPVSNISQSLAWNNVKQGYYPTIASQTRRAIHVITNQNSAGSDFFDNMFLDPPWEGQIYQLSNQEASQIGFTGITVTQTTGHSLDRVTRFYDSRDKRYGYWLYGTTKGGAGATTAASIINEGSQLDPPDGWRIAEAHILADNDSQSFYGDGLCIADNNNAEVRFNMTFNNQIRMVIFGSQAHSGEWMMKLERTYEIVSNDTYRPAEGERG